MKKIIPALNRDELRQLLNEETFLRNTNKLDNEIHSFSTNNSLKLLYEVCRLREITFRHSGGGTGKELDVDEYDVHSENPYQQLVVYNSKDQEIVGAYRYMLGSEDFPLNVDGNPSFATSKLFNFSEEFNDVYLSRSIELGRSFIQPKYQANMKLGMFSLMNLWDGLGSLVLQNPKHNYFLGKVTFYDNYNKDALDLILTYFDQCCKPEKELFKPKEEKEYLRPVNEDNIKLFENRSLEEGHKILQAEMRKIDQQIPPLVNIYINTSPNLQVFGTAHNKEFGNVLETGILIPIDKIYDHKLTLHVNYNQKKNN